jgi:radical SAM superfamily enzyme YgiQ (UPF0313 family)
LPSSLRVFQHAYPLLDGICALMPPQGLLVIAAALPASWDVRLIDEHIRPATRADYLWADAVFVTGMHAQSREIDGICRRAHLFDRTAVLGGPSVSMWPERYPEFDYLHVGELGDATDELIARLAEDSSRPDAQIVLTTKERRALADFPVPAHELVEFDRYMLPAGIQFSCGCPYQCEFCDIPALSGRIPRLKKPQQVVAELDKLLAHGVRNTPIGFTDDNFIANRRAAREVLLALIEWQKRHDYPFVFGCSATLNLAKWPDILALMRAARFELIFCGIETPDPEGLRAMAKAHNMMVPILEGVRTLNRYGMEVVSGIILGLDTDKPDAGDRIVEFIDQSKIPMATINLLYALPRTPLWERLEREGRLIDDEHCESNIRFLMPYEQVLAMWRDTMARAYAPEAVFARYDHQLTHTFAHRLKVRHGKVDWRMLKRGLRILCAVVWQCGIRADYRRHFWSLARRCLKEGRLDHLIAVAIVAHHLIMLGRQAAVGHQKASTAFITGQSPIPGAAARRRA